MMTMLQLRRRRPIRALVLAAAVAVAATHAAATISTAVRDAGHDESVVDLLSWFAARDGTYFNPKQVIRLESEDDDSSSSTSSSSNTGKRTRSNLGVFATETIRQGEVLCTVPWSHTINGGYLVEIEEGLQCGTVRSLLREMKLGEKSDFAPYVKFLQSEPAIQRARNVPSSWSVAGRSLLDDITRENDILPDYATDWVQDFWVHECHGRPDVNPEEADAVALVLQRSDDGDMVPIIDMYNHRNGRYLNTDFVRVLGRDGKIDIRASRTIEKGEQIYNSQNFCSTCGDRKENYGTSELFRDYGFVERMPQRWIFPTRRLKFDLIKEEDGQIVFHEVKHHREGTGLQPMPRVDYFRRHILRIKRLLKLEENNTAIPQHERDMIWDYSGALVRAMSYALQDALGEKNETSSFLVENACVGAEERGEESCGVSTDGLYDALNDEVHDLMDYKTCDNSDFWSSLEDDYPSLESIDSIFHQFEFQRNVAKDDTCFFIDGVLQICSNYRPYYHEYMLDHPARFIDTVKRIIFIGGGDSMLLAEALKYPSLELVVGLELDQNVVRKSFKYFHTQPHFDDERVEWWFGDATKSLLMLPRDFFGSFDLVLVDLSETVMSFAVTNTLDLLEALTLLVKPEGIFVKNEQYMEKMSSMFDYSVQTHIPHVPTLCDQGMVFGSNKIDFMTHPIKDHNVNPLHLKSLKELGDRFNLFHDFRTNDARAQGKCNEKEEERELDKLVAPTTGLVMILDVEDAAASSLTSATALLENIAGTLRKLGQMVKLTVASPTDNEEDEATVVVVTRGGYVVARTWPKDNYCAIDIYLWGGFDGVKRIKDALVAAVGGSEASTSSFRIVVGGMRGSITWENDLETMGPRSAQMRDCSEPADTKEVGFGDKEGNDMVLEETLKLVQTKEDGKVAVALCGVQGQQCTSLDYLNEMDGIKRVIPLWTCPDINDDKLRYFEDGGADRMLKCEKVTAATFQRDVSDDHISIFVIDPGAGLAMMKIVNSLMFTRNPDDTDFFADQVVFVAVMPGHKELWRKKHNFIDRARKMIEDDPLFAAELELTSAQGTMEVGVLSHGDEYFFRHIDAVAKNIEGRSNFRVDVRSVQGGAATLEEENIGRVFRDGDYDLQPGKDQFFKQKPMGRQTIFQFNSNKELRASQINEAIRDTLEKTGYEEKYQNHQMIAMNANIGDGTVHITLCSDLSVVAVWDGNTHVDIDLFTYDDGKELASKFVYTFMKMIPGLSLLLRDELPRGTGRVVNFSEDMQ